MIQDMKRQGLGVSAIARHAGLDRKTVRKYLKQGLEASVYGPRLPAERLAEKYRIYLIERLEAFPGCPHAGFIGKFARWGMRVPIPR